MANKHLLTTISCLVLLGAGFTLITRSLGVLSHKLHFSNIFCNSFLYGIVYICIKPYVYETFQKICT